MSAISTSTGDQGGSNFKGLRRWQKRSWKTGRGTKAQLMALRKQVRKIAREEAPELKSFVSTTTGTTSVGYSSSYAMASATTIPQGDNMSSRVGTKVRAKQLRLRFSVFGQNAVGGHNEILLRLFAVRYTDPSQTTTHYISDFLASSVTTSSIVSPPAFQSAYPFKILLDEVVNVGSNYYTSQDSQLFFERVIPLDCIIDFNSNSTIPASKNNIMFWACTDDSTIGVASISMSCASELLYTDA